MFWQVTRFHSFLNNFGNKNYERLTKLKDLWVFLDNKESATKTNENHKLSFWLKWMSNSFLRRGETTWMIIESHLESSRKIHLAWTWHFTFAACLFMVAFPIMLYFFFATHHNENHNKNLLSTWPIKLLFKVAKS